MLLQGKESNIMGHGIYSSNMSCWERRVAKLPQDNGKNIVIGEVSTPQGSIVEETPVVEPTLEVEVDNVVKELKKPKKSVD
jgi:hypothetical protein